MLSTWGLLTNEGWKKNVSTLEKEGDDDKYQHQVLSLQMIFASSLIILCWKMKMLHFLIKVFTRLCDRFVGST